MKLEEMGRIRSVSSSSHEDRSLRRFWEEYISDNFVNAGSSWIELERRGGAEAEA